MIMEKDKGKNKIVTFIYNGDVAGIAMGRSFFIYTNPHSPTCPS